MKYRILIILLALLVLGGAGAYMTYMGRAARTPSIDPVTLEPLLPASPLGVTVLIEDTEVELVDGRASVDVPNSSAKEETTVVGELVTGDLNDDAVDDSVLILTRSTGGSGTLYYVASALKDELGYLGTNAILLGDRIALEKVTVANGIIKVTYAVHGEGQAFTDTPTTQVEKYLVLKNALLEEVVLVDETSFVEGLLSLENDAWMFDQCGAGKGTVSLDSSSLGALEAVYTMRSTNDSPVFMTVLAHRTETNGVVSFEVVRVLTVPLQGACSVAPAPDDVGAVDEPKATTTLESESE